MKEVTSALWFHGSKGAIGATALQLTTTTPHLQRGITVKADAGNSTNFIYVGKIGVTAGIAAPTTDGVKLAAGQEMFVECEDPSTVYVIGSTTDLACCWWGS